MDIILYIRVNVYNILAKVQLLYIVLVPLAGFITIN